MTSKLLRILIGVLTLCIISMAQLSHAQDTNSNDDSVKSLGEILNPTVKSDDDGKPITPQLMANKFYKTCVKQKTAVFDKSRLKTMCTCNAAKMSEVMTIKEFKAMDKDNIAGRNARGNMLAYAYAPCMEYIIRPMVIEDCYKSPLIEDILHGKKAICTCVESSINQYISQNAGHIIMSAITKDRMTINPLELFFTDNVYYSLHDKYTKDCRYKIQYGRENKR